MNCLKNKLWFYSVIILVVFVFDQVTKKIALSNIGLNNSSSFIDGLIRFNVVQNTGGAFSIFSSHPLFFKLIGLVNIVIFVFLIASSRFLTNDLSKIGCVFVLGGTIGNLIDRFTYGAVIDFLDLELLNFAVFNVADVFIDIGVVLVIVGLYLSDKEKKSA